MIYLLHGIPYKWDPPFLRKVAHAPAGTVKNGVKIGGQFVADSTHRHRIKVQGSQFQKSVSEDVARREIVAPMVAKIIDAGDLYLPVKVQKDPDNPKLYQLSTPYRDDAIPANKATPNKGSLHRGLLLDWLHQQGDRNRGNVLFFEDGSLVLVDNEQCCFDRDPYLKAPSFNALARQITGGSSQLLAGIPLHPDALELAQNIIDNRDPILDAIESMGIDSEGASERIDRLVGILKQKEPTWGEFLHPSYLRKGIPCPRFGYFVWQPHHMISFALRRKNA